MPPKTEDQYEAIRQSSAAKIKETALELFATKGYHNTSISQIAKQAGISKGLMYNYFESKKALLHDIILEAVELNENIMKEIANSDAEPFEQLGKMLYSMVETVKKNLHHWKLLSSLVFQPEAMDEMMATVQEKQQEFMSMGLRLFSELGFEDPEKEVLLFGAILDGMFFHYIGFPEAYPIDDMTAFLLKKYEPK